MLLQPRFEYLDANFDLLQTEGTAGTRVTLRLAAPALRTLPTRVLSSTGSRTRGRSGAGMQVTNDNFDEIKKLSS